MENKTILIVDDTIVNLDILAELLFDYDVIASTSGEEALEILENEYIDLILLDIMMPDMNGFEVCQRVKDDEKNKDIPIIFITAKTDENCIEKAYDIGGTDYITKPFKAKELLARVRKELKLQDVMKELQLLASIDPMTKLYNRRYFTNISAHSLDLAKREKDKISLIMLDIDKFKNINDTYGHQVGDEVIIKLANTLLSHQRKSDIVCRYGGEEFVILLPSTSLDGAIIVAKKIREDIEKLILKVKLMDDIRFTISAGVSEIDIDNEKNIEEGLKRADLGLYEAKESGRNKVCIYNIK